MKYILLLLVTHCLTAVVIGNQAPPEKPYFESLSQTEKSGYIPYRVPPVIGAWFWGEEQFKPDGYKRFIDHVSRHSSYNLLTTAIRVAGRDITDIDVHNQVKQAVIYARERGIKIAVDLDPRLACRKFEALYPDELQESLWLEEFPLSEKKTVDATIRSIDLNDHMTGNRTRYISLKGSLLRVYRYEKTSEGLIRSESLEDITQKCKVTSSSRDSIVVQLPENNGHRVLHACIMATFTHLVPDVFAPHMMEFTRNIIKSYSDIPLAGGMRDEWGFPPSIPADRMVSGKHFWYSKHYAVSYAKKTGGRELSADCLLMSVGIKGKEQERYKAINHYMELNRQQNIILEDHYYQTVKEFFGPDAAVVTHPTWYPYPNRLESKKNGLYWWAAKRDWAQTDEVTPIGIRTALAKKWDSPVWYNQYYSTNRCNYEEEIWSCALAGGRVNYHPLYPSKEKRSDRHTQLFSGELMRAENKVRLLNYICKSPLDCPVAVVFGHPAAINPLSLSFDDVGMDLVNGFWQTGIPTDLIPTSEIEDGSLYIDENGWVRYGQQQYAVVILYNPEFEKISTADFFNKATQGPCKLFRVGDWTFDFEGNAFDGNAALPKQMDVVKETKTIVSEVSEELQKRNIKFQTPATRLSEGFGYISNTTPTQGYARLIDGTLIQVSGKNNPSGDVIHSSMKVGKNTVTFNAIGVAAVRLDKEGQVQALAAGGLKYFKTRDFIIDMDERVDLALWRNNKGEIEGIIQGYEGEIPEQLLTITRKWTFLRVPTPLEEYNEFSEK